MAGMNFSSTTKVDLERAVSHIQDGLNALHALACADEHAVTRETLSSCVGQMTNEMNVKVSQVLDILDGAFEAEAQEAA